jgi:hypothetical protein
VNFAGERSKKRWSNSINRRVCGGDAPTFSHKRISKIWHASESGTEEREVSARRRRHEWHTVWYPQRRESGPFTDGSKGTVHFKYERGYQRGASEEGY